MKQGFFQINSQFEMLIWKTTSKYKRKIIKTVAGNCVYHKRIHRSTKKILCSIIFHGP